MAASVEGASARNLDTAPLASVQQWVRAAALSSEEVVRLLRRADLTEDILTLVVEHGPWISYHGVQAGIVNHPAAPRVAAQKFVNYLYWRELVEVIANFRIHSVVRKAAENLLEDKIGEMALGEKIALARTPQRGIVKAVRKMDSAEVLKVLVKNPMLTEEDVLFILLRPNVSADVLEAVAATPKWRQRPGVCYEIVRHPRTPLHVTLQILPNMPSKDLRELSTSPIYPPHVRKHARTLYLARRAER